MPPRESIEVELKFEVGDGQPVPDLSPLVPDGRVGEPQTFELIATYLDTPTHDLASRKTTLRRRTGGTDAGWHLKRPSGKGNPAGRRELHVPFDDARGTDDLPEHIDRAVRAVVRTRELVPVAVITTERTVSTLFDAADAPIAEFCDDRVLAHVPQTGATTEWNEWEFELAPDAPRGAKKLLKAAKKLLIEAGATPAAGESKLARALGSEPLVREVPERLGKKATGLDLVLHSITRHYEALIAVDPLVRENAPDAVHQMRVAARKLRSVLTSYPTVLDPASVAGIDDDLRELGGFLGIARDREVQLEINTALLEGEIAPDDLRTVLLDDEVAAQRRSIRSLRYALSTDRYLNLLDKLDAVVTDPVPGPNADRPAIEIADAGVKHARTRLRQAEKQLDRLEPWSDEWIEQVHRIRKRAKALRYTADSARPLGNSSTVKIAKKAAHIQSLLGDFQDTVVNRQRFADLERTELSHEAIFTLGRLDAREEARGIVAVEDYLDL